MPYDRPILIVPDDPADAAFTVACYHVDLAPFDERWLGGWARTEHGSDLLFVTGYPMAKRPFYTHPDPADPTRVVASVRPSLKRR